MKIDDGVSPPNDEASFDLAQDKPFVSANVAKSMLAVPWPPASAGASSSGGLCGSPVPGGVQTRGACPESGRRAQTLPACSPVPVARLGPATRPGNPQERIGYEDGCPKKNARNDGLREYCAAK
ncbi:MAG: hypothetical protein OEY57_16375 [Nitrospirota bacterium]|nr:hypothetical protein [Nitrospirota bacterium]